jgi:DNA-binding NarL/FixJ family response regulator
MPLRLVLAEDSVLLREGLVALLTRFGHTVVETVGVATETAAAVARHQPDLLITDVRMPPGNADDGLQAAVALRQIYPSLPVLVLSQYVEQSYAAKLLDSNGGHAVGYLLKDRIGAIETFAGAVAQIASGGTVIDPEVVRQLLSRHRDPVRRLSPREKEVLELMAQGRSNASIARGLFVTEAAVNKHVSSIFAKLELPMDTDGHRRVLAVLAYLR